MVNDTKIIIFESFEVYKGTFQPKTTQTQVTQQSKSSNSSLTQSALGARFMRQKIESVEVESKCELDIYLIETIYVTNNDEFDILEWWIVD